ncbi:MAG: trigger factor [bacterium]
MKVDIQDLSSVKKKVSVTLPKEKVEEGLKNELLKIAKVAQIKGFRKGKAPFAMVEKFYMPEAMERYAERAIKESLKNIVEEHNFDLATTPVLESQNFNEDGLAFDLSLELHPKIELKNYKGLTFKKKRVEVTDDEVAKQIEEYKDKQKELVEKGSDAVCEDGDYVETFILKYLVNGELQAENFHENIDLSKKEVYPEIRSALIGSKVGDKREITVKIEAQQEGDKKSESEMYVELEVKGIKKYQFPSDEKLLEVMKVATLEELKEKIKSNILKKKQSEAERDFRRDVFDLLAKENPFEVPPTSIDNLAIKMAEDMYSTYTRYGVNPEEIGFNWDKVVEDFHPEAERSLKQQYLIKTIKEAENIDVTEEEVDSKLEELFGNVPDKEKIKYFQNNNLRNNLYFDMISKKVFDFIVEQNTVVEE